MKFWRLLAFGFAFFVIVEVVLSQDAEPEAEGEGEPVVEEPAPEAGAEPDAGVEPDAGEATVAPEPDPAAEVEPEATVAPVAVVEAEAEAPATEAPAPDAETEGAPAAAPAETEAPAAGDPVTEAPDAAGTQAPAPAADATEAPAEGTPDGGSDAGPATTEKPAAPEPQATKAAGDATEAPVVGGVGTTAGSAEETEPALVTEAITEAPVVTTEEAVVTTEAMKPRPKFDRYADSDLDLEDVEEFIPLVGEPPTLMGGLHVEVRYKEEVESFSGSEGTPFVLVEKTSPVPSPEPSTTEMQPTETTTAELQKSIPPAIHQLQAPITEDFEELESIIPDDPCEPYGSKIIEDDRRHFSFPEEGDPICDDEIVPRWYAFKYQRQWAEITTTCIKGGQCGTVAPYILSLDEDQEMPQVEGDELNATLCEFAAVVRGSNIIPNCCFYKYPVTVRKCADHFTYKLQPVPNKRCATGACIQLPGEVVPYEYLGDPPPTEPPTTEASTTKRPLNLPIESQKDMSDAQKEGIVTAVYDYPHEDLQDDFETSFDIIFRRKIADALNNLPPPPTVAAEETTVGTTTEAETTAATTTTTAAPTTAPQQSEDIVVTMDVADIKDVPPQEEKDEGPDVPDLDTEDAGKGPGKRRRKKEVGSDSGEKKNYTENDVYYVAGTPRSRNDQLDAAIFVKDGEDGAVPQDRLMQAMDSINGTEDSGVGNHSLITYYAGLPKDLEPEAGSTRGSRSVWDAHLALFITIIILALICLIIIIVGICCIKCKGRRRRSSDKTPMTLEEGKKGKKKPPMVIENPEPDEQIMRDEAPMVERENPAITPNGGGQHISKKDEDNGWVVPMDELSKAERDQAEVENTKL